MNLKPGTRVKVLDGYGEVQSEAVVERTDEAKGIVFVSEQLLNGTKLSYGCPISAVEAIERITITLWDEIRHKEG